MQTYKVLKAIQADHADEHMELRLWLLQYAAAGRLMDIAQAAPIHVERLRQFIHKTQDPVPDEVRSLRNAYAKLEHLEAQDPD